MSEHAIQQQLADLAARLERIEQKLGIAAEPATPGGAEEASAAPAQGRTDAKLQAARRLFTPSPPIEERHATAPGQGSSDARVPATPIASARSAPPPPPPTPAKPQPALTGTAQPAPAAPPPPISTPPTRDVSKTKTRSKPDGKPGVSFEMFLGGKTTAWVGAIIVVIGSAFAIREFGTGFWASLPDSLKALAVACFGGVLLAAGELALRKVGRAASVGLFSAGLGILYLDAYATHQWFTPPVVSQELSFILMAIVAAGAFAITVRTRSLTIGVLSLLGGYLTPVLLSGGGGPPLPVLVYLTILAGVSLALAARMPETFSPLRYVALGGQMLLGLAIIIGYGSTHWMMILIFIATWWTMFMSEAVLTAMRDRSPIGNVVSSLIATAAFVTVGGWILIGLAPPAGKEWLGVFTLMIAVLSAAAAMHFGPGLDTLRNPLRTAMDKLAIALWVQCGILLVLAAALQFEGYGASVGWLALALGSIEIGRRLPSRGVSIFGLIVGGLAVLRIVTLDQLSTALQGEIWASQSITVDGWAILALAALAAIHCAAHRIGRLSTQSNDLPAMPPLLAMLGTLGWLILCVRQMDGMFVTAGWIVAAGALLAAAPFGRPQRYLETAMMVLALAAVRWFAVDALQARMASTWEATSALPVVNAQMGLALSIAVGGWWAMRIMRHRQNLTLESAPAGAKATSSRLVPIALLIGGLFMLVALSFEADRVVTRIATATEPLWSLGHMRQLALTMLWTLGSAGFGVIAMTFVRSDREDDRRSAGHAHLLLRVAWGLLLACAVKWIFADTLYWVLQRTPGADSSLMPLANMQLLAGFIIAAAAVVLLVATSASRDADAKAMPYELLSQWTPVAVSFTVLWGLTFEVDRLLAAMQQSAWPPVQQRMLWWTGLWAIGGMAMALYGRWRATTAMLVTGCGVIAMAGFAWLMLDTLPARITHGIADVRVVFNLQFTVGLLVAVLLAGCAWMIMRDGKGTAKSLTDHNRTLAILSLGLVAAIGLWLGSLEIDRFFGTNAMGRQMGLSVYWMIYGVALVLVGFAKNIATCRYVGLALLAFTAAKVIVIDLATVQQIWRVVSLIVAGLLLIVTSVAYRRFAPKLLQTHDTSRAV